MPGDGILAGDQEFEITPNPTNKNTQLIFYVDEASHVELSLYDLNGRKIINVFDGYLEEGEYVKTLNVANIRNGMYIAVLKMGDVVLPKKVVIYK